MTEQNSKGAQNSILRPIARLLTHGPVSFLTKHTRITPDDITKTGLSAVLLGGALTVSKELWGVDLTYYALALMGTGAMLDGFDGALARFQDKSSNDGAILDMMSDRMQESGLAVARITSASLRHDAIGVLAAAIAGITNPIPSYYRARVEELGFHVPETGAKIISFFGTRFPRAIFGTVGTAFPDPDIIMGAKTPVQPVLDFVSAVSNIVTTFERRRFLGQAQRGELDINSDQKDQKLGARKSEILPKYILINFMLMLGVGAFGLANVFLQKQTT